MRLLIGWLVELGRVDFGGYNVSKILAPGDDIGDARKISSLCWGITSLAMER